MIFGYSTNAFSKYSLNESLERIACLGFKGVEIMCDRPHLYPPDYDNAALQEVQKTLEDTGLKITNFNAFTLFAIGDTYFPSWIEPDTNSRKLRIQHTLNCLKAAHVLKCPNISIPPGGPLPQMSRKKAISLFYKGLENVVPLAESLNVKLLIEPEPELLIENSKEFIDFMKNIQSIYVKLNFDIGHFFCTGEDPVRAFEVLFEWIEHVHIEDIANNRRHYHLIPGRGVIDFAKIFSMMKHMGYKGNITLELYPYADEPDEAGTESREHLLPLFEEAGLNI